MLSVKKLFTFEQLLNNFFTESMEDCIFSNAGFIAEEKALALDSGNADAFGEHAAAG